MDPDQFYCYPTAGEDGLIYCVIQFEKTDIVVFDPKGKKKNSLISPAERKAGRISIVKGKDGKIYTKLLTRDSWYRIEGGERLVLISSSDIPFPEKSLFDGRQFQLLDQRTLKIQNPATRGKRDLPELYGCRLLHLCRGGWPGWQDLWKQHASSTALCL